MISNPSAAPASAPARRSAPSPSCPASTGSTSTAAPIPQSLLSPLPSPSTRDCLTSLPLHQSLIHLVNIGGVYLQIAIPSQLEDGAVKYLDQPPPQPGAHPESMLIQSSGQVFFTLQLHITFTMQRVQKVDSLNLDVKIKQKYTSLEREASIKT